MKKIILTLLVSLLSGQDFIDGEKYNYNVFFGPIKMGKASIETKPIELINNQEVYHFNFSIKTSKLGDRLYKIRDEIHSWIDKEGLYLVKQEKKIREADFRRQSKTMIKNNTAVTNEKEYTLPGKVVDPYGLIMILRNVNIPEDTSKKILTLDEGKIREIEIKNTGYKSINTPYGKFNAYTYKPVYNGKSVLKNKGDMEISYAMIGDNTIPIRISIKLKNGVIVLKLKSY